MGESVWLAKVDEYAITRRLKLQERRTANAIMDYIVVPALPRKALVEWQVWIHTHNNKFECKSSSVIIDYYKDESFFYCR